MPTSKLVTPPITSPYDLITKPYHQWQSIICREVSFFRAVWGVVYQNANFRNLAMYKKALVAEAATHVELSCQVSPRLNKGAAFGASSFNL